MVATTMKQFGAELAWYIQVSGMSSKGKYTKDELSRIIKDEGADVIFGIDKEPAETSLLHCLEFSKDYDPFLFVSEHTGEVICYEGKIIKPEVKNSTYKDFLVKLFEEYGVKEGIIIDEIDGSRGTRRDREHAFVLLGIYEIKNSYPSLKDIKFSIMQEIPPTKQYEFDVVISERGKGTEILRYEKFNIPQEREKRFGIKVKTPKETILPTPYQAGISEKLPQEYFQFTKYFRPKEPIAAIEDYVYEKLFGPVKEGKGECFEHQKITTGGSIYDMLIGDLVLLADLRPLLEEMLRKKGQKLGLCAHPYDLAAGYVALKEAGCVITDGFGNEENLQNYPCDTKTNVHFMAFANKKLYEEIAPVVVEAMEKLWGVKPPKR